MSDNDKLIQVGLIVLHHMLCLNHCRMVVLLLVLKVVDTVGAAITDYQHRRRVSILGLFTFQGMHEWGLQHVIEANSRRLRRYLLCTAR